MRKPIDEVGNRYHKLVVGARAGSIGTAAAWNCVCDCGNTVVVKGVNLRSDVTGSCGCLKIKDLKGKSFGLLTVTSFSHTVNEGHNRAAWWHCVCSCGGEVTVSSYNLQRKGDNNSCGCLPSRKGQYKSMNKRDKAVLVKCRSRWRRVYSLTEDVYRSIMDGQKGCCDICGESLEEPCVDHNHNTGLVRGLLCSNCNTALGLLQDSSKAIRAASYYLDKHEGGFDGTS